MGRSKFPGKPSKHLNRQRVNVLSQPQQLEPQKQKISQNIFIGLQTATTTTTLTTFNNLNKKIKKPDPVLNVSSETSKLSGSRPPKRLVPSKSGKVIDRKRRRESISQCAIRRSQIRQGVVKASTSRTDLRRSTDGKFILPQRSVHSSRVIKPNKRFVESDDPETRKVVKEDPQPIKGLILRKAKLQLHPSHSPIRQYDHTGPFSMDPSSCSPGTVTCGVCGAVRYYRFVKQARKFSIFSCESCRKFISKMIKRMAMHKNNAQGAPMTKLVCHNGQGVCHVPPIVRSQQWNLIRCAYKARCPACWLKMCLRSFKIPAKLRSNLAEMLPANMQSIENLALDTTLSGSFSWKRLTPPTFSGSSSSIPNHSDSRIFETIKLPETDNRLIHLENATKRGTAHLRTRKKDDPTLPIRQKLSIRGPRVKHVCRSASIVLGQTLATFQTPENQECCSVGQECKDCKENESGDESGEVTSSSTEELDDIKNTQPNYTSSFQLINKLQQVCSEPVYDAVQVRQHGFGLVMSRGVLPNGVICFLCGSAGFEQMIRCAVCCEPYHGFCVGADAELSLLGKWTCPKCVVICSGCDKHATKTTPCLLCRNLFHTKCLTNKTAMCKNCSHCSKCESVAVDQVVGNVPFCRECFEKEHKGQCCPQCRKSMEKKDEVILCSNCSAIWHTDCDNISFEDLMMVRTLQLEYRCHSCDVNRSWRSRLTKHFIVGCLSVLRSLAELHVAQKQMQITSEDSTPTVPEYLKKKYFLRDCSVSIPNLELKGSAFTELCTCTETFTLLEIKRKVVQGDYYSLTQFRHDLDLAIRGSGWNDVFHLVDNIFCKEFPWCAIMTKSAYTANCTRPTQPVYQFKPDLTLMPEVYDSRSCVLCLNHGDKVDREGGRLLYCESNTCIHVGCALWSVGVHETLDGALLGVAATVRRARLSRCISCKLRGATIDCSELSCKASYHFPCAQKNGCVFIKNYRVFCPQHGENQTQLRSQDFQIHRSVYVHMDLKKQIESHSKWQFIVGSLIIRDLGSYTPLGDMNGIIIPLGLSCTKWFWSTSEPWRVTPYHITSFISNEDEGIYAGIENNISVDHMSEDCLEKLDLIKKIFLDDSEDEDDDEDVELRQNGQDILPPEIKDAIFEDLPHDVLDGISMHDIFPKLMDDLFPKLIDEHEDLFDKRTWKPDQIEEMLRRRILQLDGMNDCSESDTDEETADEPVHCHKCQCTYRTPDSYTRHLNSCETMSDSETEELENTIQYSNITITSTTTSVMPPNQQFVFQPEPQVIYQPEPQIVPPIMENMAFQTTNPFANNYIEIQNEPKYIIRSIDQNDQTTFIQNFNPNLIPQNTILDNNICVDPMKTTVILQTQPQQNQMIAPIKTKRVRAKPIRQPLPPHPLPPRPSVPILPPQIQKPDPPTFQLIQNIQPQTVMLQQAPFIQPTFHPPPPQNIQYILAGNQLIPTFQTPQIQVPQPELTVLTSPLVIQPQPQFEPIVFQPQQLYVTNTSQPVFYGLETVVQNTVMSQVMSKSYVPGMLAQNSYQATTQVFQTSTIEPIPEIPVIIPQPQMIRAPIQNITLPVQPVQNKLTNVVPPTPQRMQIPKRPMNRVLPMTKHDISIPETSSKVTVTSQVILKRTPTPLPELKLPEIIKVEAVKPITPPPLTPPTPRPISPLPPIQIPTPIVITPPTPIPIPSVPIVKEEPEPNEIIDEEPPMDLIAVEDREIESQGSPESNGPLKLVFEKQSEEGIYKINSSKSTLSSFDEEPLLEKIEDSKAVIPKPDMTISVIPEGSKRKSKKTKRSKSSKTSQEIEPKKKSKLLFKLQSQDGLNITCETLTELWQKMYNLVQESRKEHQMSPLPTTTSIDGCELLGLKNQSLKCILEEMKKIKLAATEKEDVPDDGIGSDGGAARCTPACSTRNQADHDMFSWLASKHRQIEFPEGFDVNDTVSRRASSINLPIAMRYRNLKETSRHCVGVYRSNIHGRGLFCLRDIEIGEMVIEYAGEVIRSSMTDMREKYYNSKGIGCYMFRIDDNLVVDATVKGNAARFINHSCDPNCYSRVLDILGHKHILIFALRKIQQGEELTYDYKFPFEEDKIPCTCGARRCRKYLN